MLDGLAQVLKTDELAVDCHNRNQEINNRFFFIAL